MILYGRNSEQYQLEQKAFSSGGEGDIYRVAGKSNKVVKVYHADRITRELEEKINYMAKKRPSANVLHQVAWPLEAVYDPAGHFRGFVMPKLDITANLGEVYVYPPRIGISYQQRLIIAQNICAVISEVHRAGYVFGDFNPNNIGVNLNTGYAYFLDTDSYHIVLNREKNQAYRCTVCLDGYVAPELIVKCDSYQRNHPNDSHSLYAKVPLDTFTEYTDNFALAIHIFKLLMNGFTPFNGINEDETVSTASPGLGNIAIRRDNYCFKPGKKPQSPAVPPLSVLPDDIAELFTKAFTEGRGQPERRPSAEEWYRALGRYEASLVKCPRVPTHMYRRNLSGCPWCDADDRFRKSTAPQLKQKTFHTPVPVAPPPVPQPPAPPQPAAQVPAAPPSPPSPPSPPPVPKASPPGGLTWDKGTSLLLKIGWIVFIGSIVLICLPFVHNGSIVFNETILDGIDLKRSIAVAAVGIAVLCFTSHLHHGPGWNIANTLSFVWGLTVWSAALSIYIYQKSGILNEEEFYNRVYGGIAAILIASIAIPTIAGNIFYKLKHRSVSVKPRRLSFHPIYLFLICPNLACIPLFLDLNTFYTMIERHNLIVAAIWIFPIAVFLLNVPFGPAASWYYSAMVTSFSCLVLWLGTVDGTGPIFLWFILAIAALLFLATCMEYDGGAALFASLVVVFIAGGYVSLAVLNNGAGSVSALSHWIAVAPALIHMLWAAGQTVGNMIGI